MRLTLYIGGQWVAVDTDTDNSEKAVAMSWAFDSLDNPTDYISEFGYTLTAPYTNNNRAIFDNIQRIDKAVANFDPRERYQYRLCDRKNELVSQGMCYLQSCNRDGYVLQMNGTLYDVFNKALNSGWNDDGTPGYYTMLDYIGGMVRKLNKELVRVSWGLYNPIFPLTSLVSQFNNLQQVYNWLTGATKDQLFICNIIGFAPTAQGKYTEFSSGKLADIANNDFKEFKTLLGTTGDVELTERQTLQFKSYEQQPYIYVWRLFEFYAQEFQSITGYALNLDSRWFTATNKLLSESIYMLPKFIDKERGLIMDSNFSNVIQNQKLKAFYTPAQMGTYANWQMSAFTVGSYTADMHRLKVNVSLWTSGFTSSFTGYANKYIQSNPFCPFLVTVQATTGGGTVYTKKLAVWFLNDLKNANGDYLYTFANFIENNAKVETLWLAAQGYEVYIRRMPAQMGWKNIAVNTQLELITDIFCYEQGVSMTVVANVRGYNGTHQSNTDGKTPFIDVDGTGDVFDRVKVTGSTEAQGIYWTYAGVPPDFNMYVHANTYPIVSNRSNYEFSMADFFKEKPFNILLKYSKMMNLVWIADDDSKTITVASRSDYLSDCYANGQITDLTDRVDMSQEWTTRPTSWQDRTVVLGYGDDDEYYAKAYKEKYGRSYGSKTILTGNNTNDNVQELLNTGDSNTILPAIMTAEYVRRADTLNGTVKQVRDFPLLANYNEDGNSVDDGGKFLFRQRNAGDSWANALLEQWNYDVVYITDDTPLEMGADKYCWLLNPDNNSTYAARMIVRPAISTENSDGESIEFAEAQEEYTVDDGSTPTWLYDSRWAAYITDAYDIDSRTLHCKAWLDSKTYKALKASPWARIDSQMFLCMSVDGFTGGKSLCTLDLRRIKSKQQ